MQAVLLSLQPGFREYDPVAPGIASKIHASFAPDLQPAGPVIQ
jgi:hypothetical protein